MGGHRHRRHWLIGAGGCLALTIGFLIWFACEDPPGPSHRLPDGTVMSLRAATYGADPHVHCDGPNWVRLLHRMAPAVGAAGSFGCCALDAPADSLQLWFRISPTMADAASETEWLVKDQHGCTFGPPLYGSEFIAPSFRQDRQIRFRQFTPEVYPRRERSFRFVLRHASGNIPAASFTIGNPLPGQHPQWQAAPYPVCATRGKWRFALTRMRAAPSTPEWSSPCVAEFDYSRHDGVSESWFPASVQVTDATGNRLEVPADGTQAHSIPFPALCRRESAWKLNVRFAHRDPETAAPVATFTARNLAVPGPRSSVTYMVNATVAGAVVRNVRLARTPAFAGGDGDCVVGLLVGPADSQVLQWTLLRVSDDRGRAIALPGRAWPRRTAVAQGRDADRLMLGRFRLPPDVEKVNLTFAVHAVETVEFVAKPPDP